MIAAGDGRRPKVGLALGISPQVIGAQAVVVAQMNFGLLSARARRKVAGANLFEDVPDKRRRETMRQLGFFMDASLANRSRPANRPGGSGGLTPAGAGRAAVAARTAVCQAQESPPTSRGS